MVSARLRDEYYDESPRVVDLPPSAWLSDAAFRRSVRTALGILAADLSAEKGFWEDVRKALTAACASDTLVLLRPKKWSARLIDLAAHFVSVLDAASLDAFVDDADADADALCVAVVFGWKKDTIRGKWSTRSRSRPFAEVTLSVASFEEIGIRLDDGPGFPGAAVWTARDFQRILEALVDLARKLVLRTSSPRNAFSALFAPKR